MRSILKEVRTVGAPRRALVVVMMLAASFVAMSIASPALARSSRTKAASRGVASPAKKTKKEREEKRAERKRRKEERKCAHLQLCKKLQEEVKAKTAEIEAKNTEIHAKEAQIAKLEAEVPAAEEKGETKVREELKTAEEELKTKQGELKAKEAELASKESSLHEREEELEQKGAKAAKEKERAEQEEREKHEEEAAAAGWLEFRNCPVDNPEVSACFWAQSTSGSEFTAGKVRVPLGSPITIQGGLAINEETEELVTIGPEDGAPVLVPVAQHAPSLYELEGAPEKLLSPKEKELFSKAVSYNANTTVTIELAGPPTALVLSVEKLLEEEGTAIGLATKVKLSSLANFLGSNCHVGSNEHPIQVNLTTGESDHLHGKVGKLFSGQEGSWLEVEENSLVNETFLSPGFEGCGEDPTVDEALDAAFSLPDEVEGGNRTIITGTQKLAGVEEAKEKLEHFHIPTS